ncbi:MAG: aminotransferase class I/II-fold pyridoxal phosphate-dependent enzyme [Clostridiales bacterium]|nr:aminotransferase class I/II-fold pyridoxal phosphate-dependent enzyme [Clostridiales bacterium]
MKDSLYDKLNQELSQQIAMHMPGHKRNASLAPYLQGLRADIDITEIKGFDNLHAAQGILKEGMDKAAKLWGAHQSFYLVNGSTGGILAGIRALTRRGDKIMMQRSCHMSVYHSVALYGLNPVYLYSDVMKDCGIEVSLDTERLLECLDANPDARLLVVCSPSYEGILSDLNDIVKAAHERGIKVLVDAAHGAHLGLSSCFAAGALSSKADIVVHSLHKTLPSLTQTAIAHAADAKTALSLAEQLDVFQTSSPSYLLMASIDGCIRLLEHSGKALMTQWQHALLAFKNSVADLEHLRILGQKELPCGVWAQDMSKIVIITSDTRISGYELADMLRNQYGIETELASDCFVLAQTGLGDTKQSLHSLAQALIGIDSGLSRGKPTAAKPLPQTEAVLPAYEALDLPYLLTPHSAALDKICAEYLVLYPPGIPLLVPGERISSEVLQMLKGKAAQVRSKSKNDLGVIATLHL